jgi:hypothetical protein
MTPGHVYEVRPRKDKRGVDLISDAQDTVRLSARVKQAQLKWLATREHITAAEKDEKEFIQLQLTRRRVAELETRARYR